MRVPAAHRMRHWCVQGQSLGREDRGPREMGKAVPGQRIHMRKLTRELDESADAPVFKTAAVPGGLTPRGFSRMEASRSCRTAAAHTQTTG